jgi:hypothetical protein
MFGMSQGAVLTALAALVLCSQSPADIVLRHEPGGGASLVNTSPSTPITLVSYSITRTGIGVDLLPSWSSLQSQGQPFSVTSATSNLLSETTTAADGLVFGPGESKSLGIPFRLVSDATGEGVIDLSDFAIWKSHNGQQLYGPRFGDFDYSGIVDMTDCNFFLTEMGNSAIYTFSATAIPEPTAFALLGLAFGSEFLFRRRARR